MTCQGLEVAKHAYFFEAIRDGRNLVGMEQEPGKRHARQAMGNEKESEINQAVSTIKSMGTWTHPGQMIGKTHRFSDCSAFCGS